MNSSLPIGPQVPHIPSVQWNLPDRLPPSLKKKAHDIAIQALQAPKSKAAPTAANRAAYHKEIGMWLEDVHSLCVDILKGRKENDVRSLQKDFNVIQKRLIRIDREMTKQTKIANASNKEDKTTPMREEITKLIRLVRSDLYAVHHSKEFSWDYDDFERDIAEWNSLAEHPSYPEGECLKEKRLSLFNSIHKPAHRVRLFKRKPAKEPLGGNKSGFKKSPTILYAICFA